ncbi:MAG: tetraacyldisaccharide 4'-kinase [Thermoanaerobaculia bacterium]
MILLKPLELAWRALNRLRRALYRWGVLRPARLPRPVISVGNLSAGGAGKTPAVIAIAGYLHRHGYRVSVLTRGYGRVNGECGLVDSHDAERFGDEPVLIKSLFPDVAVIVGSNRFANAIQFLTTNDCDVFILDDGFQHLQLARDVNVLIDAPEGRWFREGPSAKGDADIVIGRALRVIDGDRVKGKRVFAFSGLADNEQFFATLRQCGAILAGTRGFRDHHRYEATDLASIREAAAAVSAELIVTTQKDAVKFDERDIIPLVVEMAIDPAVLEAIAARVSGNVS